MYQGILIMASKTGRSKDSGDFNAACMSFLAAVEKELAEQSPHCGFGRLAMEHLSNAVSSLKNPFG
jgi:hypothetical protein